MTTEQLRLFRLKWLAVFLYGLSNLLIVIVSATLFRSTSFANQLARIAGHVVDENLRLVVSVSAGIAAGLVVMVSAYLMFPRKGNI
jgi:hypothetical protein